MRFFINLLWYESIALASAAIMAVRFSWRLVFTENITVTDAVSGFFGEITAAAGTFGVIAIVAFVGALVHTLVWANKAIPSSNSESDD